MAFALAWDPVFRSETPSLWLGAFTGAPLVLSSIWIGRHREWWERAAVLIFGALGLGLWLLTTLAQTPAQYHPPILAVEAVIVTASFFILAIAEFPLLALSVILLAQFLWFRQLDSYTTNPWWSPFTVVVATLGLSFWWQSHGRTFVSERALAIVQALAAAAAVAILILAVEIALGVTPAGMVIVSALAIIVSYYAIATDDRLLLGFGQFLIVTAIGEFIGQLTHAPVPGALSALAPIVALLVVAPGLGSLFPGTIWERPARWIALLYRALATVMFVVWTVHYVSEPNRFVLLAFIAVLLLLWQDDRRGGALLLASSICAASAVIIFWLGHLGEDGFHLRHLLGFVLLLAFGQILRRKGLLSDEVQRIGILVGLASVTEWIWLWVHFYAPSLPMTVIWAIVAAAIVCVGWWLAERMYLAFGWGLLGVAFVRVLWVDLIESRLPMGTDPAFQLGLVAVGLSTLVAALVYTRRPARPSSDA
jgi:hypothetical protein